MTAALPPARRVGIAGTTLAHGGLVLIALIASRGSGGQSSRVYEVNLVAAPVASGTSTSAAAPAPKTAPPPPVVKATRTPAKRVTLQAKQVTPTPAAKTTVAPAPGEKPSTGTDVVTLHQDGLTFPYPRYLEDVVNAIYSRWQHELFRAGLNVKIAFVIARDGSVDIKSLEVTKKSVNYSFDLAAQEAIELAARAHAFAPLPSGWNGASLPIEFNFEQRAKGPP